MQIIITGGAGFLGQKLAGALLQSNLAFDTLMLVDKINPSNAFKDDRVQCRQLDLSQPELVRSLVTRDTGILYHLAAIVSSHAEGNFDLGWQVNMDITRHLLEACRYANPDIRFVFTSSLAVYGGSLPDMVNDTTALKPASSYGAQKAIGELLVNDYTRKKFIDGRVLRLPTICVRPGKPNQAASSFVSSIIREPLNGEIANCPVSTSLPLWLSSPDTVIENMVHAVRLKSADLEGYAVNLPGIKISVQDMLSALERVKGRGILSKINFKPDPQVEAIVGSWPAALDNTRALKMGFIKDRNFDDFINQYINNYFKNK